MKLDPVDVNRNIDTHFLAGIPSHIEYTKYRLETAVKHPRMKVVLEKFRTDAFMHLNFTEGLPLFFASP